MGKSNGQRGHVACEAAQMGSRVKRWLGVWAALDGYALAQHKDEVEASSVSQ